MILIQEPIHLINYMELLAESIPEIGHKSQSDPHFQMMDISEVLSTISLNMAGVAMILEYPAIGTIGDINDNDFDTFEIGCTIIKYYEDGNHQQKRQCINDAAKIIKTIKQMFKIANRKTIEDSLGATEYGFHHWERKSFQAQKVGPVFGTWVGYRFTTIIGNPSAI